MSEWSLRVATPDDAPGVLDLWRHAEATPSVTDNLDAVRKLIESWPGALLVAEADGELVGSVIASFDGWRGNLYRLAVAPEYRRRGIARALVEAAEARLRRLGAKRVSALVESDHPRSVGFWDASVYQPQAAMRRYVRGLDADG